MSVFAGRICTMCPADFSVGFEQKTATYMEQENGLRARKKRETRAALERATLELVAERGLEGATIDDICARANVSRMTFFNYFPTKLDAVLGYEAKPLDAEEVEWLLDERSDDCYLDVLVDLISKRCASGLDPEILELRRKVFAKDVGLLLREKQGMGEVCQKIADALEAYLLAHPQRRMIEGVAPKEEALFGSSFAAFLAKTLVVRRINTSEELSAADVRHLFAAYAQA